MGRARLAARAAGWACSGSLALFAAPAHAAPALQLAGTFATPIYATAPPGDTSRVFVVERAGRVRVIRDGTVLDRPFLDLSGEVATDGERGMLSMAFAADYASSGRFYLYLTATAAAATSGTAGEIQVREYRRSAADPDVADLTSERILLAVRHDEASNHNGGQLQIGPDGKLWLATGDGGIGNDQLMHAQDVTSQLGKLLRLDVNQPAPAPEQLARGLRNPWRFSFDRAGGQLIIADVGQGQREEVDVGLADNYGWPCREGSLPGPRQDPGCATATTAVPVFERPHEGGVCAIVGGYVVRDPGVPTLSGRYLYGDDCAASLRSIDLANPSSDAPVGLDVPALASFGEDACGRILVVSLNGPVYRLVDGAPSACPPAPAAPAIVALPPLAVADTRPCGLAARVTGLRSVRRRHYLAVALRSDEACRATVSARVKGVAAFRVSRPSLRTGVRRVVRLGLTARGRRALRRHHSLRATVRVQAVDGAGNVRTLSRKVRLG